MKRLKVALSAAILAVSTLPGLAQSDAINSPFVVAINHEPDTLDPSISVNTVISRPTLENIVEPIVALDAEGNLVPGVADFAYSEDGTVLTFTIKEGVTFHNGMPLTADDIVFSHERMAERSSIYQSRLRNLSRRCAGREIRALRLRQGGQHPRRDAAGGRGRSRAQRALLGPQCARR